MFAAPLPRVSGLMIHGKDRSSVDASRLQTLERAVCVRQRKCLNPRLHRNFRSNFQKIDGILARAVRNTAKCALMVQRRVLERWDGRHRDAGKCQRAAFPENSQSPRHQFPAWGKTDSAVEQMRRDIVRRACPGRPEFFGKFTVMVPS